MTELMNFELAVLDKIQDIMGTPFFDNIWLFFTHIGDYGLIWIAITVALLMYPKTRRVGIMCLIALLCGAIVTNGLLKNMVARARPYNYKDIALLIDEPHDYSFPSGHTTASFAVAFVLLKERLKVNKVNMYIPILIIAILVAFSRMYLYVHFPSDILAAIVIAYFCSVASRYLFMKLNDYTRS
ncbi:phosphatase PAP2 family protein [Clostridium sediminicola]|uniref:phosphatase PAP2 family protein n=1 Tax=Clostridium sediminicola TaxID=3114879 RepID=UPI0031F2596A